MSKTIDLDTVQGITKLVKYNLTVSLEGVLQTLILKSETATKEELVDLLKKELVRTAKEREEASL